MKTPPTDASLAAALALGGTRVATLAHPHCRCGKPKPPLPPEPPIDDDPAFRDWLALRQEYGTGVYRRQDCPVHDGTAGGA